MVDKHMVCFHKVDEENAFLSNWYPSPFELDGIQFSCVEQYMMYQKAMLFHDEESASAILATNDPEEIKAIGRAVKNYDDSVWSGRRQVIVYRGLMAKFEQNPELDTELCNTGDAVLAECVTGDKIWGIGLSIADDRRFNLRQWQGQNLLGYTLMEVRDRLKGGKVMAHIAIYRCNLCGEKFQYGEIIDSKEAEQSIDCLGDRFETPTIMMPSMIGHHCSDGSYGVAEFLGYEKAD